MTSELIADGMHNDTALFVEHAFAGYILPEELEEKMEEYRDLALKAAENESWDTAIVYAILEYDTDSTFLLDADLMTLCVPYKNYIEMASKLMDSSRLFFLRGRKETINE